MVVLTQNIRCKSIPSKNKDVKIHTKLYFRNIKCIKYAPTIVNITSTTAIFNIL